MYVTSDYKTLLVSVFCNRIISFFSKSRSERPIFHFLSLFIFQYCYIWCVETCWSDELCGPRASCYQTTFLFILLNLTVSAHFQLYYRNEFNSHLICTSKSWVRRVHDLLTTRLGIYWILYLQWNFQFCVGISLGPFDL